MIKNDGMLGGGLHREKVGFRQVPDRDPRCALKAGPHRRAAARCTGLIRFASLSFLGLLRILLLLGTTIP